jgi:hypothetical protein
VRKSILLLVVAAALGGAGAAAAGVLPAPPPPVTCSESCGGGGTGFTGCNSQTASHSASIGIASIRHFLVVNYCKRNGIITSIGIAAHGCDTHGLITCRLGPAWKTGGGVGYGWATYEAHATYEVAGLPFTNTDVLTLTVPTG